MKKVISYPMIALCVVVLVGGAAFAPSAAAAGPGLTGTVVFQTSSGGPIYAINADGSHLRLLTNGMDPALSPDGKWVAFTRWEGSGNGDWGSLWVINIDGSGERQVQGFVRQPKSPTWSPDGTQISVDMQHGGWVAPKQKCSSSGPPPGSGAYDIHVSQEGPHKFRFCYTLPPNPYWGIEVVDVSSGNFLDQSSPEHSISPTWDPADANRLVYKGDLGLVNLNIKDQTTSALTSDTDEHSPAFSPDGGKIAMAYWQGDHWEIQVMNADASGRTRLTETTLNTMAAQIDKGQAPHEFSNTAPAWSPDGKSIAFLTDRNGAWEIWVMNADGSNQRPMFSNGALAGLTIQYHNVDERVITWR
jgi:dipeptidyl aminopeptidase/acylaminoacyl peptidase